MERRYVFKRFRFGLCRNATATTAWSIDRLRDLLNLGVD